MTKIPCEIARDLFPSYIDGLTSKVSNEVLEEHLRTCEACREALDAMREEGPGQTEPAEDPAALSVPGTSAPERKEIDFLRKNRRRNRKILFGSAAGALVLALLLIAANLFAVGRGGDTSWAAMNLSVEGQTLSFDAVPTDSASAIAGLHYEEKDGTVTVSARSVLASPLHPGSLHDSYQAEEEIREVRIGDRIIWSQGATVSDLAAELFTLRHDYAGDMPANDHLAQALSMPAYLGAFTNELETEQEPYGWRILLEQEVPAATLPQKERDMDAFGSVLVGLTGNLDHVTFVYSAEGTETERTVTAADATALLGEDIKNCMQDVRTLDNLIRRTGLALYALSGTKGELREESMIRIRNLSDTEILSYEAAYYKDGELCSSGGGMNADGTSSQTGEMIGVPVSPMEFGGSWEQGQLLEIEFAFERPDHTEFTVPERIRMSPETGKWYDLTLTGSAEEGYMIIR